MTCSDSGNALKTASAGQSEKAMTVVGQVHRGDRVCVAERDGKGAGAAARDEDAADEPIAENATAAATAQDTVQDRPLEPPSSPSESLRSDIGAASAAQDTELLLGRVLAGRPSVCAPRVVDFPRWLPRRGALAFALCGASAGALQMARAGKGLRLCREGGFIEQ